MGMSALETERHVVLESAFNFRDLGGYPAGPDDTDWNGFHGIPQACGAPSSSVPWTPMLA